MKLRSLRVDDANLGPSRVQLELAGSDGETRGYTFVGEATWSVRSSSNGGLVVEVAVVPPRSSESASQGMPINANRR